MIPEGEVILFAVTFSRQAGADMYAAMFGRVEAASEPSLRCPLVDEQGQPWPQLAPGMRAALERWHREGRIPPARVVITRLRTHPVDSSVRAYEHALSGLLRTAAGQQDALRPGEVQLRAAPALSPPLQNLADAGHLAQAIELIRATQDDHTALRRLLLEAALTHPDGAFLDALFGLAPARAEAALSALVAAERPQLLAALREPTDRPWLARKRREALASLDSMPCDAEHAAETLRNLVIAAFRAGRRGHALPLREALLESVLPR